MTAVHGRVHLMMTDSADAAVAAVMTMTATPTYEFAHRSSSDPVPSTGMTTSKEAGAYPNSTVETDRVMGGEMDVSSAGTRLRRAGTSRRQLHVLNLLMSTRVEDSWLPRRRVSF
jgi:hypothetical protein